MDYEGMKSQVGKALYKTAREKEMREAKQALAAAEVAEQAAERKYREASHQRRRAEYRLSQVQFTEREA